MKSKKRSNLKYILVLILAAVGLGGTYLYLDQPSLEKVAEEQLKALERNDVTKAYFLYTSRGYQRQHRLEEFRDLIASYPALSKPLSSSFYGETIDGGRGALAANLTAGNGEVTPVLYTFVKEGKFWKIDTLEPVEKEQKKTDNYQRIAAVQDPEALKPSAELRVELIEPVNRHLQALKKGETAEAYYEYLAKDFKRSTSMESFQKFIETYPELTDHHLAKFGEAGKESDGHASLEVSLITQDGEYPLHYTLKEEGDEWKIWALEMEPQKDLKEEAPSDVFQTIHEMIKSQLDLIKQGNVGQAYNRYVSDEFRKATDLDEFETFVKNYPELKSYKEIKFDKEEEDKGLVMQKLFLVTDNGKSEVNYWLVKTGNEWKIWGINILSSATYPPIETAEKEELGKLIKEQLQAIKEGDVSKSYYAFISKEFEQATSFDDFKNFLESYPIFSDYTKMEVGEGITEGRVKLVHIKLFSKEGVSEVDYRLVKEGDKWKIWGIQILSEPMKTAVEEKEIEAVIKNQMDALKEGDISRAYYAYTSQQFQEAATREQFKEYVDSHPELKHNRLIDVVNLDIKPNMVIATVVLGEGNEGRKEYEYRFVQENQKWKILGMQMTEKKESEPEKGNTIVFDKMNIGTKVDLNGMVTEAQDVIKERDQDITANLFIENGRPGQEIEVVLEHKESTSRIPPIRTDVEKEGDSVINFIFYPPTQGWPVGNYTLHVKSSDGASKEFTFKVMDR